MDIFQAQTAGLMPAAVDNGDGTYSRKIDGSGTGSTMTLSQAQTAGLKPAAVNNGDQTYSPKVATS